MTSVDPSPWAFARHRATAPKFSLRFGAVFKNIALPAFLGLELVLWAKVHQAFAVQPWTHKVAFFLYFSPNMAMVAGLTGLIATAITWLVFRVAVRPAMVRWYNPRPRDVDAFHPLTFVSGVEERPIDHLGARRLNGRRAEPGTLVRSTRGITFHPFAFDGDPWSISLDQVDTAHRRTPTRRVLGLLRGYPDHVVVRDASGAEATFVTGEPSALLDWFRPSIEPAPPVRTSKIRRPWFGLGLHRRFV
jgi:hypothetical protein